MVSLACVFFTANLTASYSYSANVNALTLVAKAQSQNEAFPLRLRWFKLSYLTSGTVLSLPFVQLGQ